MLTLNDFLTPSAEAVTVIFPGFLASKFMNLSKLATEFLLDFKTTSASGLERFALSKTSTSNEVTVPAYNFFGILSKTILSKGG